MLYPTHHHHFLFKFNPFPHFPPSSHFQGMEPVQGGFGPDTAVEVGAAAGDDFFVDELLDFSNGDTETEQQEMEEKHEVETEKIKTNAVSQGKQEAAPPPEKSCFSGEDGLVSFHESDMSVEGLESLEWLSHFVEDSFSDYSLAGKVPPESKPEAAGKVEEQPCFTTPVQTKARTKRARAGIRVWPVLSSSLTEPSTSSSSSTSSTTSFQAEEAPAKRQKKKPAEGGGGVAAQPRRCSHCGVTKTPQWRAGPLGSKTLCNACGVRYKSGRLLPEYRPACSPTFSSELHSNNHRKVLEMRRKKETEMAAAGLPPPVQSF